MTADITSAPNGVLHEDGVLAVGQLNGRLKDEVAAPKRKKYERQIVWGNVIMFTTLHLGAAYGLYTLVTYTKFFTFLFAFAYGQLGAMGITAGAHRLWSHRSYKATWQLRLLLMIFNTIAIQDSVIDWCRDHRVHHKYSDTNADPYNSKRGFFFSHIGWLCVRKHPDLLEKGKGVDLSDLKNDPILAFQKKHYVKLFILISLLIPTLVPVIFWNESVHNAFFVTWFRYVYALNATWLVNSAAHMIGNKPYDKDIAPAQNWFVSLVANGEGWHNFHHVFPWDYKTAELAYTLNFTTLFIDFFAWIGWAYELKSVSPDLIKKRVERTGDGSHAVWGWDDEDQPEDERKEAVIYNGKNGYNLH